ncbi:UNVERIFIED_CONTAM: hypothetical protein Sangu_0091400 [Sesamum angustifolium]|uniref:Serine aminopeptidase S33 domain-containing protein n=1 Tax=Sesamum angustifolium TaxID=2727405 RepID=A0AAW2RJE7_9LAMI
MARRSNDGAAVMLTSGTSERINALFSLRVWRSLWLLINACFLILLLPFRGGRRSVVAPELAEKGGGAKEDKPSAAPAKVVRVPAAMAPRKSAVDKEVAARRALAVKRVMEDNCGGDNNDTVREFSLFVTSRGDSIFTQSWTPVKVKVRGVVVLLHGLNEHSGRYMCFRQETECKWHKGLWNGLDRHDSNPYFVLCLTGEKYEWSWTVVAVYQTSRSFIFFFGRIQPHEAGTSDMVEAMAACLCLEMFLGKVLAENPGVPCFCFGHSNLGGAYSLEGSSLIQKCDKVLAGVVLTSPAVWFQPSHPIFAVLAPVFSFLLPRFQVSAANKGGTVRSQEIQRHWYAKFFQTPTSVYGSIRVEQAIEFFVRTTYCSEINFDPC